MLLKVLGIGALVLVSGYFFFTRKMLGYEVRSHEVVYKYVENTTWKRQERSMQSADPKTFKTFGFSGIYGKDKDQVYLEGYVIRDADPETFKATKSVYKYATDKNSVFYKSSIISSDPETFRELKEGFAVDANVVYNQGKIVEGSHGPSFEIIDLNGKYAKDKNQVYCFGGTVENADPNTFELIKKSYSKDKKSIYYLCRALPYASPASFKILNDKYSTSEELVYYENTIVENAHAASFEMLEERSDTPYAKDKYTTFAFGKQDENLPERILKK